MDLNKKFLTYMDKKKGFAERMPFDLFNEEAQKELDMLTEHLNKRKEAREKPLKALTFFNHLDGSVEKIEVDVIDYDPKAKKFLVTYQLPKGCLASSKSNENNQVTKLSARLNLTFLDFDTEEELRARFNSAQLRRKCSLIALAQERMILNDLIHRYKNIEMPQKVKLNIKKLA